MKRSISQLIEDHLYNQGITKASVAKSLGMSQQNFSAKLSNKDLATDFVWRISEALKHNFFADLAAQYDAAYSVKPASAKDETIELLKAIVLQNQEVLKANAALQGTSFAVPKAVYSSQLNEPDVSSEFTKKTTKK